MAVRNQSSAVRVRPQWAKLAFQHFRPVSRLATCRALMQTADFSTSVTVSNRPTFNPALARDMAFSISRAFELSATGNNPLSRRCTVLYHSTEPFSGFSEQSLFVVRGGRISAGFNSLCLVRSCRARHRVMERDEKRFSTHEVFLGIFRVKRAPLYSRSSAFLFLAIVYLSIPSSSSTQSLPLFTPPPTLCLSLPLFGCLTIGWREYFTVSIKNLFDL